MAGVGTNRYSYSFNDPVNSSDPNGNTCGGSCSMEDQERIEEAEPAPLFDETAEHLDNEIDRLQKEIEGLPKPDNFACASSRECGGQPGQGEITERDIKTIQLLGLVAARGIVPADTNEAALLAVGGGAGKLLTNTPKMVRGTNLPGQLTSRSSF